MILSLLSFSIDTLYIGYWLIKNGIQIPYYTYCYMMGYNESLIEINKSELEDLKKKIENQEKLLIELNSKFSNNNKVIEG